MNSNSMKAGLLAVAICFGGVSSVRADLPTLEDKEWLGYFIGVQNRDLRFDINTKGKGSLTFVEKKGNVAKSHQVDITFQIEETLPSGKTSVIQLIPDSLTSDQAPTNKPQNVIIKGKVAGDATFEIYLNEARGAIALGGKVTGSGSLQNLLKFSIHAKIPNAYNNEKIDETSKLKAFEAKLKKDRFQAIFADGKKGKITSGDELSTLMKSADSPAISAAQLDFAAYDGRKYALTAEPNSSMSVSSEAGKPIYRGLEFTWTADAAKDPEGKARLLLEVK
jgi:hypothetical protein